MLVTHGPLHEGSPAHAGIDPSRSCGNSFLRWLPRERGDRPPLSPRQRGKPDRLAPHPALLVVDEIGYLSVTPNGAKLFFQLVNARYERASTVLTSNKGFEHWGEILHDEVMAAALLDRLLHRSHTVNIRGNSFRMRRHMELSKAIHPTASRTADAERARKGDES